MLKAIALGLLVLLLGFLGFVATRPASYHVERSASIAAPAEVVFSQLDDFRAWGAWSPWERLDPTMNKSFEGPARRVGSSYAWHGNDQVGKGKMTLTERTENRHVGIKLEFIEPFASAATTEFDVAASGPASSRVTWSMDGHSNFMGKLFGMFVDFDTMIGADYEKGLAALARVSEAEAKQRAERDQVQAGPAAEAQVQAQPASPPPPAAAP
jgi:hypothetical protein